MFKSEIRELSERAFLKTFEKKWNEGDLFSVNLMLSWAEDKLSPAAYVKFNELYHKLSDEGFSDEEENVVTSIK